MLLFAAPGRIEHIRIESPDATYAAALYANAESNADGETRITSGPDSISIDRTVANGPLDHPADGLAGAEARQAIDAVNRHLPPTISPAVTRPAADLVPSRAATIAMLAETDHIAAATSASLTGIARLLAEIQLHDLPADAADAAPARALLAQLQARRIDLAARYTADYPGIAIADDEIAQLQAVIDHQHAHAAHPATAAIATLRTERQRLTVALQLQQARSAVLATQITTPDAASRQPMPVAPPPPPVFRIDDLGSTEPTDPRAAATVVIAAVAALTWWLRRPHARRRPAAAPFAQHVAAVEQQAHLPVLRCLDVHAVAIGASPQAVFCG